MNNYQKIYPGIPLVESPFFDFFCNTQWSGDTLRIAKDLNKNGFAVIDLLEDEVAKYSDSIIENLYDSYDWAAWNKGLIDSLRIQDAWVSDRNVKAIATNKKIIDLLTELYGRKAFPFQTLNFPVGTQQALHCDYAHFSSVPERFMCGVWVALEDVTDNNGALFYVPGSHKFKTVCNEDIGWSSDSIKNGHSSYSAMIELWSELSKVSNIPSKKFIGKKGQAIIWLSNLIHGGSKMLTKEFTRNSQVTHYFFEDCAYTAGCSNDAYNGQIRYLEIKNINTGEIVPSKVSGVLVTEKTKNKLMPSYMKDPEIETENVPQDFDGNQYLALNIDVKNSGISPLTHYLNFGIKEGRRYK